MVSSCLQRLEQGDEVAYGVESSQIDAGFDQVDADFIADTQGQRDQRQRIDR